MQLDCLGVGPMAGFDLLEVGVDEQRDLDSPVTQGPGDPAHLVAVTDGVEPPLGGQLLAPFGDQRARVGPLVQRQIDHRLHRRHL